MVLNLVLVGATPCTIGSFGTLRGSADQIIRLSCIFSFWLVWMAWQWQFKFFYCRKEARNSGFGSNGSSITREGRRLENALYISSFFPFQAIFCLFFLALKTNGFIDKNFTDNISK